MISEDLSSSLLNISYSWLSLLLKLSFEFFCWVIVVVNSRISSCLFQWFFFLYSFHFSQLFSCFLGHSSGSNSSITGKNAITWLHHALQNEIYWWLNSINNKEHNWSEWPRGNSLTRLSKRNFIWWGKNQWNVTGPCKETRGSWVSESERHWEAVP